MGLFGKTIVEKTQLVHDPELADRVAELERKTRAIDVEWTEMFEKFNRLHARLAKREQREKEASEAPEGPPNGSQPLIEGIRNPLAAAILQGRKL